MNVVIDDHLLREILLEGEPTWLRRARGAGEVITTGSWYFRLCSALHDETLAGELSGPIAALPLDLRSRVMERVASLPSAIELRSMREVAWHAAGLGRRHGLNLLAAEALAVAVDARAAIATAAANLPPTLQRAAGHEGVRLLQAPS